MTDFDIQLDSFVKMIQEDHSIVFFGGAGVSTDAGIPDFRSTEGVYAKAKGKYPFSPEQMVSHQMLMQHPKLHYQFMKEFMDFREYDPTFAHRFLKELEDSGKDVSIVTQNCDSLHQKAGSSRVYELHGNLKDLYCMTCKTAYTRDEIKEDEDGIPRCPLDGGIVRSKIVLFGEMLDEMTVEGAISAIARADLLIVAGTSLSVYPAAGFLRYFRGKDFVVINKTPVPQIHQGLFFQAGISEVFQEVAKRLNS